MRILVAEDDVGSRRLVKVRLVAAGHEVVDVADGQSAWELFQREFFQIVITDWMMPKLDGPSLIQKIRASNRENYTYIILLTAIDDKPKVVMGLEAGADEYLTKPFDAKELVARVASGERIIRLEEQLIKARQQMETLAMQDSLTGLLNRRAIEEHAHTELSLAKRKGQPLSVILLDIDHFKDINDKYGHPTGDNVLRQLAETLPKNLRQYDRIGRWGGEEFIVILPDTEITKAMAVAERMRTTTAETEFSIENGKHQSVQISLGVTCTSGNYASLEELVDTADLALYKAKQTGRNRVCCFNQSDE